MTRHTTEPSRASSCRVTAALACLAFLTLACNDSTEPLRAVALAITLQPPSTAQSGIALGASPTIELRDRNGALFGQAGVAVTASISSGGGTLAGTTTQITDAGGRATFSDLTISGTVGPRTLTFAASGLSSAASSSIALSAGPAATLFTQSPATISSTVNTAVTALPAVVVKDASGNAVAATVVTFSAPNTAGSLTGTTVSTNASGVATLGGWMLPTTAGQYVLTATAAGVSGNGVTFTATATPDAPAGMQPTGSGQSVLYGSLLPSPLQVRVVDQFGNPTPGVVVTWGSVSGLGSVQPINVSTGADGIVRSNYRLGTMPGENVIRASINPRGLTADFSATALGFSNELAVGYQHTCALDETGVAYCWGQNDTGQLGFNSTSDRGAPVPVAGQLQFKHITAGAAVTCGISTDDLAYCWGSNSYGALGDGTQTLKLVPTPASGGLHFSVISNAGQSTCGLTITGAAYCWGDNGIAQLGVGSTPVETCTSDLGNPDFPCSRVPIAVSGGLVFASISAGGSHVCGLTTDSKLYCWGFPYDFGGTANGGLVTAPQQTASSFTFAQISAGAGHTCGIIDPSSVYCWGNEEQFGLIGNGFTDQTELVPVHLPTISATHVHAGVLGTCALATDGRAFCWGYNETGATGDGTLVSPRTTPVTVATGQSFTAVGTSGRHACGRTVNGQLYCWGENSRGQLGIGGPGGASPTPVLARP
jgi:alpha-tubulin suppressor-like RCC1 family protein